jgi:prepilin-type N-terminal cleavage/methylation domain-containing protein
LRRDGGFNLVEVLVAMLLLTVLFLPIYTLFVQGRDTTFRSKLAYLSAQVAREEIEDLRLLARSRPDEIPTLGHDWRPVKGNALSRLEQLAETGAPTIREMDYPKEYSRIFTKVEVSRAKSAYVFPSVLHVRWQEHGERFGAGAEKEREGFSRFDFFLVRPTNAI